MTCLCIAFRAQLHMINLQLLTVFRIIIIILLLLLLLLLLYLADVFLLMSNKYLFRIFSFLYNSLRDLKIVSSKH